jgi:hypothetical protein
MTSKPRNRGARRTAMAIGKTQWAIPEGYIPADSTNGGDRRFVSHEAACLLNANDVDAEVVITIYFTDREPAGPYRLTVPARRVRHMRFNDLREPEAIPRDTPYASVLEASVPIVVQHTRLDSRQSALALLSTIAYSAA